MIFSIYEIFRGRLGVVIALVPGMLAAILALILCNTVVDSQYFKYVIAAGWLACDFLWVRTVRRAAAEMHNRRVMERNRAQKNAG